MIAERIAIAGLSPFWTAALLLIAVYCLVQAIRDIRGKHYAMAALGFLCAALLLLMPIRSQVVKLDLPEQPG
jgi:hypothetical protein